MKLNILRRKEDAEIIPKIDVFHAKQADEISSALQEFLDKYNSKNLEKKKP